MELLIVSGSPHFFKEFSCQLSVGFQGCGSPSVEVPGFTITAVLMLALGIGATTAIFSIVEGGVLRPLPFPEPDRLMVVSDILQGRSVAAGNGEAGVTVPRHLAITARYAQLHEPRGYQNTGMNSPASANRQSSMRRG